MPAYLNYVAIAAARNGTTSHTVNPSSATGVVAGTPFTPTAGRRLVVVADGSVTSTTPSGWTLPSGGSAINTTGLYVWHRVAAGGDTFSTTHNGSNFPAAFAVYEFPASTSFVGSVSATPASPSSANPTLSGLTGSNTVMGAAAYSDASGGGSVSATWNAPNVESLDTNADLSGTDGYWLGIAYQDAYVTATYAPTPTISLAGGTSTERLTFAVTPPTGGTTYEKVGTGTSATLAQGVDIFEAAETGTVTSASRTSGADIFEGARTITASSATRALAARVFESARAGTAANRGLPSGTDSHEAPRAGTVSSQTLASGPSEESTGGGTTYEKTCTATTGALAGGADTHEATRTCTTAADTTVTGADTFEATETGTVTTATLTRGSAQAGFVSKLGTAATGTLASGADVFTAAETGLVLTQTAASGPDAFTAARTGGAASGSRAGGASQKVSPTTYVKVGTLVVATLASTPRSVTTNHAGTIAAGATATATAVASPAIPRWPGHAGTRWPGHNGPRWDDDGPGIRWETFR